MKMKNNSHLIKLTIIGIVTLCIISMTGCSVFSKKEFSPAPAKFRNFIPAEKIIDELTSSTLTKNVKTISAQLKINASGAYIKGKKQFFTTLLSEVQKKIRLRFSAMVTSTLCELLLEDEDLSIFMNDDNIMYRGGLEDLKNAKGQFAMFNVDPYEVTRALYIRQNLLQILKSGKYAFMQPLKNHYQILVKRPKGGYEIFAIRKSDLLPEEIGVYDSNKKMIVNIKYKSYKYYDKELMPEKFVVSVIPSKIVFETTVNKYNLNPALRPEVFIMPVNEETRVYPVETLLEAVEQKKSGK